MDYLNALVLGIIEGLTEFLPVSSTGHLILAEQFFPLSDKAFADTFMVVIQSGAILAVILTYFTRFIPLNKPVQDQKRSLRLWSRTLVGFVPFAILAFLFNKPIKAFLFAPIPVALALIVWGIIIISIETWQRLRESHSAQAGSTDQNDPEDLPWSKVLGIGLFQCFALIPGTSRSAATIVGGLVLGTKRLAATEFSFFLAIPTLLAASAYEILDGFLDGELTFSTEQWLTLLIGTAVSFAVALVVIKAFIGFIKKHDFRAFGVYRIILGVIVLVWAIWGSGKA